MKTALRWIAVLPGTLIGMVLVGTVALFLAKMIILSIPLINLIPAEIIDRLVMAFLGPLLIAHISSMIAPDHKDKTAGVFLIAFALFWFWVAITFNADIFVSPIPWKGIGLGLIQASLLIGSCIYSFRSIRELHG